MKLYELTSTNLTHLGGPMGSEYTTENFHKLFRTLAGAKAFAEKDYGRTELVEKIKWRKEGDKYVSGDLRWVEYTIEEVKGLR